MAKERFLHFDILKGIAILFVILGHIYLFSMEGYTGSFMWNLLGSVHMPLFFLISGYFSTKVLDTSRLGIKKYWFGKVQRLLVPLCFAPVLMNWIEKGFILELPTSEWLGRCWFTYALFLVCLVFYLVRLCYNCIEKSNKRFSSYRYREAFYYVLSIAVIVLLTEWAKEPIPNLHKLLLLSRVKEFYPYFVLGFLMKRYRGLEDFYLNDKVFPFAFFGYASLLYIQEGRSSFIAEGIPIALLGLVVFYSLSYKMAERRSKINNYLAYLGQESLAIYLTHYFFLPYLPMLTDFLRETISNKTQIVVWDFWIGVLGVLLTLLPILIVIRIIKSNRYLAMLIYGERL